MRTLTTEHMKAGQFRAWLESPINLPGYEVVYAVGELGRSVEMTLGRSDGRSIRALQQEALDAWYDGKVHLVQRRAGLNLFSYVAVKCHGRKRERPTWQDGFEGSSGGGSKDGPDRREGKEGRQSRVEEPVEL